MKKVKSETTNYLFFSLSNIGLFFEAISLAVRICYRKLLRWIGSTQLNNYPKRAFKLSKINIELASNKVQQTEPLYSYSKIITPLISLRFDSERNFKTIRIEDFADPEIFNSLNRWYWLVFDKNSLNERTLREGLNLVLSWVYWNPCESNLTWEPYACSERISSFSTFYILKKSFKDYKKEIDENIILKNFYKDTANVLTKSLEYYPTGITYNHVVNDLKGLIICAISIDRLDLADKSFDLLMKELDIVVDREGFLREGSSHYQLIFCRWICELSFFLKKGGYKEFQEKLNPFLKAVLCATSFFLVKDENENISAIPLFGDLSPDFSVEWMISYFAQDEHGNPSYGPTILRELKLQVEIENDEYITFNSYSRLQKGSWLIFVKHSNNDGSFYPSHEHEDFGAFVLFYKNRKVIIDRGRESYLLSHFNDEFCHSSSHNTVTINNQSLTVNCNNHYFSKAYKKATTKKSSRSSVDRIKLSLTTNGTRRFGPNMFSDYKRVFLLKKSSFEVIDYVVGLKEFTANCTFNFEADIKLTRLNNNCFNIDGPGLSLKILSDSMDGEIQKSSAVRSYMRSAAIESLLFTKESKLLKNSFYIKEE